MRRSSENFLRKSIQRTIARGGMNTGPVLIKWRVQTGTVGNRNRESSLTQEQWETREETLNAFIHYAGQGGTVFQRHSEVQTGDVILDFPGEVNLSGRMDLQFIVDDSGTIYVRKDAGRDLAQTWDVRCGGRAITMTLLLRPQTGPKHVPPVVNPGEQPDTFQGETIEFQGELVTFSYP